MAEQTAVDWLVEQVNSDCLNSTFINPKLIKEAQFIQYEQMRKCASFWRGKENDIEKPLFDIYYKENYGK